MAKATPPKTTDEPAQKPALRKPKHGRGALLVGGIPGNPYGKLGGRPPDEFKRILQQFHQNGIGLLSSTATTKNHCVAALDRQNRDVDSDIWTSLVDYADYA